MKISTTLILVLLLTSIECNMKKKQHKKKLRKSQKKKEDQLVFDYELHDQKEKKEEVPQVQREKKIQAELQVEKVDQKQQLEQQQKQQLELEQKQNLEQQQKQQLELQQKQQLEQQQKKQLELEQKQNLEQQQKLQLELEQKQNLEQQQKLQLELEQKQNLEQQQKLQLEQKQKQKLEEQQKQQQSSKQSEAKYQDVEMVSGISDYSKVDISDRGRVHEIGKYNEDSYHKMNETPMMKSKIIYEIATLASTPIALSSVAPLWANTNVQATMLPVAFPSKPIQQEQQGPSAFQSVLKTNVHVNAHYIDAQDPISFIAQPLQQVTFSHQVHTQIIPNQLSIDSLVQGMSQEMLAHRKKYRK